MNSYKKKSIRIFFYSLVIIFIDQLSKNILYTTLGFRKSIKIIPAFLNITLVKNKGAAFSLFSNSTLVLTIISLLASIILITIIFKNPPSSYWNSMGLTYLLGGTFGNGIDRLLKGYVIDFLELIPVKFPIFNLADIAINIAIICFIIDIVKSKRSY